MNIFFTAEYDESLLPEINKLGDVTLDGWAIGKPKMAEEELISKVKDCDILITSYDDITRDVIAAAPNLKLIACTRATPVNIDVNAAKARDIPVIFTPGRNSDSTAELAICHMLNIARKVPMAYKALHEGRYTNPDDGEKETAAGLKKDVVWDMTETSPYVVFKGFELKNKRLGIVGYGSIGKRVGRIARAFGMSIIIYDPYVCEIDVSDIAVTKANSLEQLLTQADFVTVHLKPTKETDRLIGKKEFAMMKKTAYFINTSRAAVIDEDALIEALRNNTIAGAALDVFEKEPIYMNHPFIKELDNIIITPHIAGATYDAITNHTKMIISDLKRFFNNEPLLYVYR